MLNLDSSIVLPMKNRPVNDKICSNSSQDRFFLPYMLMAIITVGLMTDDIGMGFQTRPTRKLLKPDALSFEEA